jgi:hypothetical protein
MLRHYTSKQTKSIEPLSSNDVPNHTPWDVRQWTKYPDDDRHTLTTGGAEATAWKTPVHGWGASVRYRGMVSATYDQASLEDAQAWCLRELVNLRIGGKSAA